ncbi:ATP-dependent dethiobiotin synthetase [Acrasis kona]|uniref:ATP-dependent dethiobiotin synthetase n=1 Tax=Acrasis kona TaxID=1008807 RepID=A0AAW2YW76_9EUKA
MVANGRITSPLSPTSANERESDNVLLEVIACVQKGFDTLMANATLRINSPTTTSTTSTTTSVQITIIIISTTTTTRNETTITQFTFSIQIKQQTNAQHVLEQSTESSITR